MNDEIGGSRHITVLLADDHPLFRKALRVTLEAEPDIEVIGEVEDGRQAVDAVTSLRPAVVLIDIAMPGCSGLEATRRIKHQCPTTIILALTVHDDFEHVAAMLQAGAAGYLTKDVLGDEVVQAVRAVATGDVVLSPLAVKLLVQSLTENTSQPTKATLMGSYTSLTTRELEILKFVAKGFNNAEIGNHLGLSRRTVSSHLEQVFEKLRVASRTEAVAQGLRLGLLSIDDFDQQ